MLSPLYEHYERKIIRLMDSGKILPTQFRIPLRLVIMQEPKATEDPYDYTHTER